MVDSKENGLFLAISAGTGVAAPELLARGNDVGGDNQSGLLWPHIYYITLAMLALPAQGPWCLCSC